MKKAEPKGRGSRRTRAQWSALIEQYAESELTQSEFCEVRGLAISSFTTALRRWRETPGGMGHAAAFVPVRVDDALRHVESSAWDVELTLGAGIVLRIRGV